MMLAAALRRLVCGLCMAAGLGLAHAVPAVLLPDRAIVLGAAEFVKSDDPLPPDHGWQPQALPDSWRLSRPGQDGYAWYRFALSASQRPEGSLGLLINHVGTTYAVYVNGVDVGDGGGMSGQIRRNGGVPQFVTIAPQVLEPGENWLYVRLRVASNLRGGLSALELGPRSVVEDRYERIVFWRVTLSRSANVALIVTGLLVGVLWLRQRQRSIYGYFAALAVLWSLRNFHYTYTGAGFPSRLWEAFILGSLGVIMLLLCLFMLRLTGQSLPRAERAMKWLCLTVPSLFFVLGEQAMSHLRLLWYGVCVAIGVAAITILCRHLREAQHRRKPGLWLILLAMLATLGFGLHDYAVSANLLPYGSAVMMAFGAPLLLAALVFTLAGEYFGAIAAASQWTATLEQRVAERTQELSQTYARLSAAERATAVAQERERLMRDIHDGVGSQLITAKVGMERGNLDARQAGNLIGQCIDDLRLVIDSLDPEQRHVADALATLRYRMAPKLAAAGVESVWQIGTDPVPLPPASMLDLMRIVQEALTNVLKHSGAGQVTVSFKSSQDGWQLDIADQGCGMPALENAESAAAGRGLSNMRSRAARLHARLDIRANNPEQGAAGGTAVSVVHQRTP